MRKHVVLLGMVAWGLLFSIVLMSQCVVVAQATVWRESSVQTISEELNAQSPCCEGEGALQFTKKWGFSPGEGSHEQAEMAVLMNTPQGASGPSLHPGQPAQPAPTEKELGQEEFVLEPIHLLLVGSILIGFGMLRNRHRKV